MIFILNLFVFANKFSPPSTFSIKCKFKYSYFNHKNYFKPKFLQANVEDIYNQQISEPFIRTEESNISFSNCYFLNSNVDKAIITATHERMSLSISQSYFFNISSTLDNAAITFSGIFFHSKSNCFTYCSSLSHTDTISSTVLGKDNLNLINLSTIVFCGEPSDGSSTDHGKNVIYLHSGHIVYYGVNSTSNSLTSGHYGILFQNPFYLDGTYCTITNNANGNAIEMKAGLPNKVVSFLNIVNNTANDEYPLISFKEQLFRFENCIVCNNRGDHFIKEIDSAGGTLEIIECDFDINEPVLNHITCSYGDFGQKDIETIPISHLQTGLCQTVPLPTDHISIIIIIVLCVIFSVLVLMLVVYSIYKKIKKCKNNKHDSSN